MKDLQIVMNTASTVMKKEIIKDEDHCRICGEESDVGAIGVFDGGLYHKHYCISCNDAIKKNKKKDTPLEEWEKTYVEREDD